MNDKNRKKQTEVSVSLPASIKIVLVPANDLKQYELFQWLLILLAPIAVGFWTSYATPGGGGGALFWSAWVFTATSALFIVLSIIYRRKVYRDGILRTAKLDDFT